MSSQHPISIIRMGIMAKSAYRRFRFGNLNNRSLCHGCYEFEPGMTDRNEDEFNEYEHLLDKTMRCCWQECGLVFESNRKCYNHLKLDHNIGQVNGRCFWKGCTQKGHINHIRTHVKKHFDIVEALCTLCKPTRSFKWRFDLNKHLKEFHTVLEHVIEVYNNDGFDIHIAKKKITTLPRSLSYIVD